MLGDTATACKADCLLWRIIKVRPTKHTQLSLPQLAKDWLPVFYSVNKCLPMLLYLILFCFAVIMAKCGRGEPLVVTIPQTHKGERGYASSFWSPG